MRRTLILFGLFIVLNFGGLTIGNWLMNDGPNTSWYLDLNKAPWTPPGWVFGFAWTIIMLFFSFYLAKLFNSYFTKFLLVLFTLEIILNVSWNFIFFNQHLVLLALIIILLLTSLIFYIFFKFKSGAIKQLRWLLLPYMIWLCIASSLNLYILIHN